MTEVVTPPQSVNVDQNGPSTDTAGFFLAENWMKTLVFAVISFAAVFGTFMYEGTFASKNVVTQANFTTFNYKNDNIIPENGIIRFDGDSQMNVNSIKDKNYVFELKSGKVWGDFSYSTAKTNFVIGNVVLIPDQAVFDANFDGSRLELNVYDGDVYVGFLADGVKSQDYVDPYNLAFINRVMVPRENQLTVPMNKVTEAIRPLLYSKLVKEFKLAALSDEQKNSSWSKSNKEKDKKIIELVRQQFSADQIYEGPKVQSGLISDFAFWSEENLTFVPEKKTQMLLNHLFNYLDDATFYSDQGEQDKFVSSFQSFNDYMLTLDANVLQSKEFYDRFDRYIEKMRIFGPGDSEYKILKELLNRNFIAGRNRNEIVASFWQDVYKGLNTSDALAEDALNNYYVYFDKTRTKNVAGEIDDNFYRNYLAYQNQLFDNLLLKYHLFYKDGYFAIKTIFENDLLSLYADGQSKDELKQAFVNNKINFMLRLKRFFFDGYLSVQQAKEIYKRLFSEINDFMPKDDSGVAVIKLFESQLADMDDFWGYLNSPEYQIDSYGSTHEDRYKVYLQDRPTIASFANIKKDLLGEAPTQSSDKTVEQIAAAVKTALQANKDVSNIEVGKINTVDQRYVPVKLVLGGYPVEANYDRDNDAVKDVKVYNQDVSDRAVKLSGLLDLLQKKFADLAKEPVNPDKEKVAVETTAQRFAKIYIAKKMFDVGFNVTADNVKIVDQLNAVYRIENVTFKDRKDLNITFDVLMSGEMITNGVITFKDVPQYFNEKYTFAEFANMVAAEGQTSQTPVDTSTATPATTTTTTPADSTDIAPTKGVTR